MQRNFLGILFLLVCANCAFAQTEPAASTDSSFFVRSDISKQFWVGISAGLDGNLATGAAPGGTIGGQKGLNLRYKFDERCAVLADWHVQDLAYEDPAHIHNSVFGAGAACTVFTLGKRRKFWRDAHLQATALLEYGRSEYHIYMPRSADVEVSAGTAAAVGAALGAEFFFPLYFGFWANAGANLEWLRYKYNAPSPAQDYISDNSTVNFILRIGLSYAF